MWRCSLRGFNANVHEWVSWWRSERCQLPASPSRVKYSFELGGNIDSSPILDEVETIARFAIYKLTRLFVMLKTIQNSTVSTEPSMIHWISAIHLINSNHDKAAVDCTMCQTVTPR